MRGARHLAAVAVVSLAAAAAAQASNPVVPTPIGSGARYHPGPRGPLLAADRAIRGLACSRAPRAACRCPSGAVRPWSCRARARGDRRCAAAARGRRDEDLRRLLLSGADARADRRRRGRAALADGAGRLLRGLGAAARAHVGLQASALSVASASVPGWTGVPGVVIPVRFRCCGTRRSCSSSGALSHLMRVTGSRKDSDVRRSASCYFVRSRC